MTKELSQLELSHARTIKNSLIEVTTEFINKAKAMNHPQAALFEKVLVFLEENNDPQWFLDRRRETQQNILQQVARTVVNK
jgi:hypothetical protein